MSSLTRRKALRPLFVLAAALLAAIVALVASAPSPAAVTTFGSPLTGRATLNTSDNLAYSGVNIPVPPAPDAPNGYVHDAHFGSDTALWNVSLGNGQSSSPATGQATKVRVQGCAEAAPGGPPPLRQVHLQDLAPLPAGSARVNLTSQPFELPVCGQKGASGSTISTFKPINLCVKAGDYVGLNDEGGFVPSYYPSGVPYRVIGRASGSTMDSFIRGGGTNNGATLSRGDTTVSDGFASNRNEELMLQVTLGTGPDATHICAGGSAGAPAPLAPLRTSPQTDGVNHSQDVSIAVYCRPRAGCGGVATLGASAKRSSYGRTKFTLPGDKTGHLLIHISSKLMKLVRRPHGATVVLTIAMGGQTYTQTITIKILY
jgi:hypothetical protein